MRQHGVAVFKVPPARRVRFGGRLRSVASRQGHAVYERLQSWYIAIMESNETARIEALERAVADLARRLESLERHPTRAARAQMPRQASVVSDLEPPPPPPPAPPEPAQPARRETPSLEDVLGGRVLAWLGGTAVLLGIVFFLAMAVRRGWIDEPTRTVLAALASATLVALGVWSRERHGRIDAALVATATGIAGLFATLVVATQVYELVAPPLGLLAAGVVGAAGTALAVRWRSVAIGSLGLVGALLAPVLVDAGTTGLALAFMAVALAATAGVLLWQRWNWLALAAFAVSLPQLAAWGVAEYDERLALTLAVLVGFWALYVVAAIGYELRSRAPERLPVASWLLLAADATLLAGGGYAALAETDHGDLAVMWLVGVALAHVALGVAALRWAVNREVGSLLVTAGLVVSAIAFADALDGPALVAGWAVQAVLLAYLARRAASEPDGRPTSEARLTAGAAAYLALAAFHVLAWEAEPRALRYGVPDLAEAAVALVLTAAAAFGVAALRRCARPDVARAAEATGAAAAVYLVSVAIVDVWGVEAGEPQQLGQLLLSAFWTATGLTAVVAGLVRDVSRLRLGGLALLGAAAAKVFAYDLAELDELYRVLSFIALGLFLLGGAFAYARLRQASGDGRP